MPNQVSVVVNGQAYWIPSEKYGELLNILNLWKSIQQANVTTFRPHGETNEWKGQQIIND